jgi:hypothetical protein
MGRWGDGSGMVVAAIVAAIVVIGLLFYAFSGGDEQRAGSPPSETTGQSEQTPAPGKQAPTPPAKDNQTPKRQ